MAQWSSCQTTSASPSSRLRSISQTWRGWCCGLQWRASSGSPSGTPTVSPAQACPPLCHPGRLGDAGFCGHAPRPAHHTHLGLPPLTTTTPRVTSSLVCLRAGHLKSQASQLEESVLRLQQEQDRTLPFQFYVGGCSIKESGEPSPLPASGVGVFRLCVAICCSKSAAPHSLQPTPAVVITQ